MPGDRLRAARTGALLAVATLFLVAGMAGVWVQREALDTDRWVETSGRLLEDQRIRSALSGFVADRIAGEQGDSEGRLGDLLAGRVPDIDRADAARPVVERAVAAALGSGPVVAAWEHANRAAHTLAVELLEGDLSSGGDVALDLDALASRVLDHPALRALVGDARPADGARLAIVHVDELEKAQDAVLGLRALTWLLLAASLVFLALAVHLHPDRRRAVIAAGGCVVLAGVALLGLREVAGDIVVGDLARSPDAEAAGHAAWSIGTTLLVQMAVAAMVLGALVAAGAWLAGRRAGAAPAARSSRA